MEVGESRASGRIGWAIAVVFIAQSVLLSIMPRIDKFSDLREDLRGVHYTLGVILLVLVGMRLWRWAKEPIWRVGTDIGPGLQSFNRTIALVWLAALFIAGLLGFVYAWAEGRTIHILNLFDLPALMAKSHGAWMLSGYFHSASALLNITLTIGILGSGLISLFRRGRGVIAAFPAGIGAMALTSFLVTVYVFNSFRSVSTGLIAVAVAAVVAGLVALAGNRWGGGSEPASESSVGEQSAVSSPNLLSRLVTGAFLVCALGLAAYGPYLNYGVVPWATGSVVKADPDITWHQQRLVEVEVDQPSPLQDAVEADAYKWCKFCHTMKAGEAHLIGPNLHNIIGQRAGTAPNYHYSDVMAEAGRNGLVWDEETIKAFIAGPEKMVPGNRMIVNRGPVTDPVQQDAIVNLLKRDAMTDGQ